MNRVRTVAFLLLLAIAAPALAFRGRPVSDLSFEDRIANDYGALAAASDGTDYLVLIQHGDNESTYAQIISQGVPYGPAVLIGYGFHVTNVYSRGFGSVIWTGSQYLVAWADENTTYLSAVSRRGALLSGPRRLISEGGATPSIVSNGRKILAFNKGWGALISLNGDLIGHELEMVRTPLAQRATAGYTVTGTGGGFAVAVFGKDTRVLHFYDDGYPGSPGGTFVEGPLGPSHTYYSNGGKLASDGTNVILIFNSYVDSSTYAVKSIIIDSTHEQIIQPLRTLLPNQATVGNVLWNGSEYVVVYSLTPSTESSRTQSMLQRISSSGKPLDAPLLLTTEPRTYASPMVAASNGREYLVAISRSYLLLPIGSRNPPGTVPLAGSLNSQEALVFARGQRDFLAVWRESDRNGLTIRASRLDAKGRYREGTGIVLATFPNLGYENLYFPGTISVDSDGSDWLVVWTYAYHAWGCRVSSEGVVLDPKPIDISPANNAVVRWGGTSWLVVLVLNTQQQMASATVTSGGLVGPVKIFEEMSADLPRYRYGAFSNPVMAFDGQQFVVAVAILEYISGYTLTVDIVTERLEPNGDIIGSSKFISPQPVFPHRLTLSVATNGFQDLIVFQSGQSETWRGPGFGMQGLLLNRGFAPATITIDAAEPIALDTAWNGAEFIVAHVTQGGDVQIKHLSPIGFAGETIVLPRDSGELTHRVVYPPSSPAAQTTLSLTDLPLGFLTQHLAYDGISRAEIAFAGDLPEPRLPPDAPVAPIIGKAMGDPGGVTVTWQPQVGVLGFQIELRQSDGSERVIGVAAGSASSTHIAYAGLTGTAIRLRAWNAAGISAPSADAQLTTPRFRVVGK